MFLGDSGAQQLGFLMAAIGVAYNPIGLEKLASCYVPILVLGIAIFDATLVAFPRWRRGEKIDRVKHDHTFHHLCEFGLEPTRAVFVMHLTSIVLGFVAFIALTTEVPIGNVIFGIAVLCGVTAILAFEIKPRK